MPSWHLADAAELAARHPYTFYKSPPEAIAQVRPGEVVKLIFAFHSDAPQAPGAERMWVLVDTVKANGHFTGKLDNMPGYIADLQAKDTVAFEARHIINTQHDDDDNLVNRYAGLCFVTKRVLEDGAPVGYLYREEPDNADDSGWRFTANDESDDYINDSANVALVSLGAVLGVDDRFIALLDSPTGTAYAFDRNTQQFMAVDE
ncbi:immunity protein Imm33 domain-containing protein [Janthinobacterium sp. 1_2014MBL_MicDiv]|uniref:immunity protein Imm33 domain-containing protein n=1 Tax=Janthinobacterium sp. 1_2014MBL_MicDiv TaxID=1644131 RepID=UPI0008F4D081|nr:DUF2185 domain-containing protein [Janthinobacterium sp. 1_2014MBL_MicDiv]APA67166.1 hypothetical protein YQ44_04235 [Janthinobacterium sp. 1_2014MBL_MicDiv]